MAKKSWLETLGSEIKAGIKKVLSYGSFEPNYIENRQMPSQAAKFKKQQKAGAPK